MKTPTILNLKKIRFTKRYQEDPVEMEISKITIESEFQQLYRSCRRLKSRLIHSMRSEGFHKNKSVLVGRFGDVFVLIDGHQRLECAIEAGLTKIWVILRKYESRAEALRAAKNEQDDRRNRDLPDVFRMLQHNLLRRAPHRPKSTLFGGDIGDSAEEEIIGLYDLDEIEERTDIGRRTLERYLELLRGDKNQHLEKAHKGEIPFKKAMELIRLELKGPPKPRKLSDEILLMGLFENEARLAAWVRHCSSKGQTSPRQGLLQLAYHEMLTSSLEYPTSATTEVTTSPENKNIGMDHSQRLDAASHPSLASEGLIITTGSGIDSPDAQATEELPPTNNSSQKTDYSLASQKSNSGKKNYRHVTGKRGETNYGWPLEILADSIESVYIKGEDGEAVAARLSTDAQPVSAKALQTKLLRVLKQARPAAREPIPREKILQIISKLRKHAASKSSN